MEEYILENRKKYENLAEKRVPNIKAIEAALDDVADFIKSRKRVLYGGIPIDFALKAAGGEGIYGPEILPDFDFYSPENVIDSLILKDYLQKKGFDEAEAINGLHLTTRRVRIDKISYVADLSYYPEPYFGRIPTLNYKNFLIVHPGFQRIDIHLSLSYLYGPPGLENFRNRLKKDIKRFGLLDDAYPLEALPKITASKKNLFAGMLMENFGRSVTADLDNLPDGCVSGFAALRILQGVKGKVKIPDPIEIFTDNISTNGEKFDPTCDIFPEALVVGDIIYYNNFGRVIAANKRDGGFVVNAHFLCCSFLFKYFMLGNTIYLDAYKECIPFLKNAVNGYYYGSKQISMPALFADKKDKCKEEKGVDVNYRPFIKPFADYKEVKIENFPTYKIAGKKTDKFLDKTPRCN